MRVVAGVTIQSYRDLSVWQKAMTLAVSCYELTKSFPPSKMYGMTTQIRRASASIAANIAEGHGPEHTKSFVQFLRIAQGSLKELETHLALAKRVDLADQDHVLPRLESADELGKMLRSLIRTLRAKLRDSD